MFCTGGNRTIEKFAMGWLTFYIDGRILNEVVVVNSEKGGMLLWKDGQLRKSMNSMYRRQLVAILLCRSSASADAIAKAVLHN